ncbi:hypothetical protein J6590_025893 [Homalodisca vitripennis]|nr:hypothetical protein J6590_025893 [Homalodisca vitripennis]
MQFLVGMWIVALGCTVVLSAPADQSSAVQVPDVPAPDVGLAPETVKSTDVSEKYSAKSSNSDTTVVITPEGKLRAEVTIPELLLKSEDQPNKPTFPQIITQFIATLMKIPLIIVTAVADAATSLTQTVPSVDTPLTTPEANENVTTE